MYIHQAKQNKILNHLQSTVLNKRVRFNWEYFKPSLDYLGSEAVVVNICRLGTLKPAGPILISPFINSKPLN